MMSQNIENVVKQGYLKRGHYGANRISVLFRRGDVNKWFVFTIRRGVPFLEYYDSDVDVFTQQPINSFNLSHCQNVRSMGNSSPPSFCVVCPDRVIELVASSRAQMVEWVNEIEASLVRLGILKTEVVDHVYSVCPAVVRKPRVSLEVSEENLSEPPSLQFPVAVTEISESRHLIEHPPESLSSSFGLPPPPPRSSVLKQPTSSFKPVPRLTLTTRTLSSFHSSHSDALEEDAPPPPLPARSSSPPPLPARSSSGTDKTSSRTQSNQRTVSDQVKSVSSHPDQVKSVSSHPDQAKSASSHPDQARSVSCHPDQARSVSCHPATDGSNDSDFVSPEIIAELRFQRENSRTVLNSNILDSEIYGSTNETSPESSGEIDLDMSRSGTEHNPQVSRSGTEHNTQVSRSGTEHNLQVSRSGTEHNLQVSRSGTEHNTQVSRSGTEHNTQVSCSLSASQHQVMALTFEHSQIPAGANDLTLSVDNDCAAYRLPESPESLDIAVGSEGVVENTYSVFPCQQGTPGDAIGLSDYCGSLVSHTPKPVAVPRKQIPKTYFHVPSTTAAAEEKSSVVVSDCSSKWHTAEEMYTNLSPAAEEMYNNLPPAAEEMYTNLPPAAEEMYTNLPPAAEEMYTNLPPAAEEVYNNLPLTDNTHRNFIAHDNLNSVPSDMVNGFDNCTDSFINLKPENEYNTVLNAVKDDNIGADHCQLPLVKDGSDLSKDENENVYGLVFYTGPPLTKAPPIPPLPSGHYSHPSKCFRNESCTSQDPRTALSSAKYQPASTVQSAFHAAASNKYSSFSSEATPPLLEATPPLLLPRKTNSFHAFLPRSSATSIESRDAARILFHTSSLDDQPPALPSRASHSFFIKRPQITGISSNKMISCEGSNSQSSHTSPQSLEGGPAADTTRCPQTDPATCVSSLSTKMLLDRAHSLHTVVSLKQTQAEILQTEISLPNVTLTITHKAGHGIALVDWNSFSCVVGWNQKDFPSLYGKLHLGDLIFSINGVRVTSAETAQKLLKKTQFSSIELMLHRMPYAKVFAIRRNAEGQSLGIKRNGGTGEIVYVDPNGLAAQYGLTPYAQSVCEAGRCNWFLVEINNRPLSLFFKDDEIDHRLSAVGREISLVVQPCDFIYEIRRRFKKLRNYKQFITQ